jgi:hypothetical protein
MKFEEQVIKDTKYITEIDENTGKYKHAQKVGRNVMIGLSLILAGVLYSIGGINLIIGAIILSFVLILLISVIIYIIAKYSRD